LRPIQDQSKLLNVQERYIKRESESISSSLPFPRLREVGDLFDWELKKVSFSAYLNHPFLGENLVVECQREKLFLLKSQTGIEKALDLYFPHNK
jgi:hypothetical protein